MLLTRDYDVRAMPRFTGVPLLLLLSLTIVSPAQTTLRIVVVEGEGAVNVVQQKSAVAPVIEVRDRNDQPVAGAAVTFVIRAGRASFNGARSVNITTNAAGRAVATGLTPTGSGPLQIGASAAFQGQTAAATIAQTNVLTATEAATGAGAAAGGSGSAAGGGSAGVGGGLSNSALLGVVGAAAGGTVLAVEKVTGEDPKPATVVGSYAGQGTFTYTTFFPGRTSACVRTEDVSGTLTLTFEESESGAISGSGSTTLRETIVALTAACTQSFLGASTTTAWTLQGTGGSQNLTFTAQQPFTRQVLAGGSFSGLHTLTFTGNLANGVVSGTLRFDETADGDNQGSPLTALGSATTNITLR